MSFLRYPPSYVPKEQEVKHRHIGKFVKMLLLHFTKNMQHKFHLTTKQEDE